MQSCSLTSKTAHNGLIHMCQTRGLQGTISFLEYLRDDFDFLLIAFRLLAHFHNVNNVQRYTILHRSK